MGRRMERGSMAWRGRVAVVASLSAATVAVGIGGTVAMAQDTVPTIIPTTIPTTVVEVGLPPVPPTTVVVDVGLPPVPPTTETVEVEQPPLPPLPDTFGDPTGGTRLPALPDTFGDDEDDTTAGVSSIAGAIAATADAAWRSA